LRLYWEQFEQLRIDSRLSLQSGEPDEQIRAGVAETDPDLVIIAAETHPRLVRFVYGEIVAPLLRWVDRPLLIAHYG
jgi:nucleotide-binding universal stress UspA family protein